jgi:hypothetical protein
MLLKYKIFLFLLITIRALGQDNIISKYEKADLNYKGRIYSERLEIDTNKSLLLKIEENSFLVFNEKNDVYSYYVTPSNTILKNKMNRNESIKCLQYLDSLKSINPSNLNVTETKADKPDSVESISVEDGITYSLEFFKNNITIQYHTYSPEVYIEHKFPFYKERQKLLNAFNYYKSIFKYSRKDNLGLKRTDSLYIIFDFKMTDGIGKSWVKKPNNDEVFSVWNTERDTIVFIKENAIQAQNPYVSKRFLKKRKNKKIINIDDLIKLRVFDYLKLIENNFIFLINEKEISKKIKLNRIEDMYYSERPQECE